MRTVSIVGARPQFIKLAPVSRAMARSGISGGTAVDDFIVHTGQHYDAAMSDVFFEELMIPRPNVHLGVGSGPHGRQTGRMLEAIEAVLSEVVPDLVIVYGDTNSTLAGALAASKLNLPIGHIEAGLRSRDRNMPEEINRIVTDHVSDLLFAPTSTAVDNLQAENLADRTCLSGDVMLDAVLFNSQLAKAKSQILQRLSLSDAGYALATLHRASNTEAEELLSILQTFSRIAVETIRVVFPVHPRTAAIIRSIGGAWRPPKELILIEPTGYLDMLSLVSHCKLVLTDSGGLQKEALFLGRPCITLREQTEWPETIVAGGNVLTGTDPTKIHNAVQRVLGAEHGLHPDEDSREQDVFGNGNASEVIVQKLAEFHESKRTKKK